AVVGAGAFGGWTALHLRRAGAEVTLLDAWGPGNARASSGGETRVIRGIYGGKARYVELTARAFMLWWDHEARWNRPLYRRTGALWMFEGDDSYARSTLPLLRDIGLEVAQLPPADAARRYPQIDFTGVQSAFFEIEAGYLRARDACATVVHGFLAEGGDYRAQAARPGAIDGGGLRELVLSDGSTLSADRFVFACGPWLGELFPDAIGDRITPTRQEVVFFGPPKDDRRFDEGICPTWMNFGDAFLYGIPGNDRRGFKVADDTRGPRVDPTTLERVVSADAIARARALLARRFPALARAPVVEARVCQYEQTPDGDFILDRHPGADNVWLAGGGSGHGFKMGPAVGELVAGLVLGTRQPEAMFALGRFGR
ncbi:MAG TPA: FAD-dependent oxidoreductase, partial [Gemmatimonadales bacterium]|nr:FAD-dependent oxidoreductase [Gemmatimonadales bacterium]